MAGRHPIYKTAADMQQKIDEYFNVCAGTPLTDSGGIQQYTGRGEPLYLTQPVPPTITGLAYYLGFASRQTLLNYQNKKQFNDTITRAKLRIESYAETRLFDRDGQRGAEFCLRCNFGWTDKPVDDSGLDRVDTIIKNMREAAGDAAKDADAE